MPNNPEDITIGDGITTPVTVDNGPSNVTIGSDDANVTVGDGQDTITAGNNDTIKVGNGPDTITLGNNDSLTEGNGQHTITAGNSDTITVGNGPGTITAGTNSTITAGNGPNQVTAGPHSTIVAGNGPDTVYAGHDSSITLGTGQDTVHAGTTDTITFTKAGQDTIDYDGLTPAFTVPAAITVSEEHTVALPITMLPPSLGNEVINGFKPQNGIIGFDTSDFANASAVLSNAAQAGSNVVITQPGGGGTVTLTNTNLSSLTAANFAFFTGTDVVNISGVPTDATLSAGTNNGGGNWTLSPAQLSGLTLTVGEPIGYPTPDTVTVTITNPAGQSATASESFPLVVNAIPPTVSDTVMAYQSGDPITETRLQLNSSVDSGDGGNDYINRIVLSGVPTGTNISSPDATVTANGGGVYTLSTTGHPASFNPEVDVTTPSNTTTNFNLGITTYADEPNSPELSASTSQNINVQYEPASANPDFQVNGGNMWTSGSAFSRTFNTFIGVDYPNGFPGSGPAHASTSFLGTFNIGGSFGIKAGLQSDLTLNGGSYNASLPYNIGLANTFNKTNDTLEVDPSSSQGTASLSTFSPQGSYDLSLILDALLRAFAGPINLGVTTNINDTLFSFNSSQAHHTFSLPDGIGSVVVAWPTLNLSGSGAGSTVSASGVSNPILGLNIDPIAVISDIVLGSDPFKGSGGFTVGLGGLHWNYTLAAGTIEPTLNLGQSFNLSVGSLGASLTDNGSPESFSLSSPTIIQNAPATNNFDLTLTPNSTLSNDTSLASQLIFGLKLLAASGKITAGVPSLSITTTVASGSVGPLFHVSTTVNLGSVSLYQNTFPVAFGSQSVNFNVT